MAAEHDHPTLERHCDVAVLGGSAAGLAAALQLVRQRRTVLVVDDGTPRNAPAGHVHGYLGREATAPDDLARTWREEVRGYGGEVLAGRALDVRPASDGRFRVALTGGHALLARRVVAATGTVDELPDIDGLAEHWGRGVIHCPFCHGYEVRDRRLFQVVTHPMGLHPTALLRHLTDRLTLVVHDEAGVDPATLESVTAAGIPVIRGRVESVASGDDGTVSGVLLADGRLLEAHAVVVSPRFRAQTEALAGLGVGTTTHPTGFGTAVEVDAAGLTSVPGVYAAGNLTDPGLQLLPAAAHGSRVGAMVAFDLADEDLRDGPRVSGENIEWEQRYGGEDPVWSANPNGTLVAEASALAPGRALDVGAGEGADALWLAENGWQVTASDISGRALARLGREAERRGLAVRLVQRDATGLDAFVGESHDLVSLQYGSFHRSPDQRGLANLLAAVAPGGTLLVVGHDLSPLQAPPDVENQNWMFDPSAYVGIEEIAAALGADRGWEVEVHETRPRPLGAASTHHVDDVVLRARRRR